MRFLNLKHLFFTFAFRRGRAVLALLLLLLSLPGAEAERVQGADRTTAPELIATCNTGCTALPGSPITIIAGKDAGYQVYYTSGGKRASLVYQPLFDEGDAGLFVRYNNAIIGPDFWNHLTTAANAYDPWTNLSQSGVTGSGTVASPWAIETKVIHPLSGVMMTTTTSYVNGSNSFRIDWEVCLPQAGTASTFLAADFYLQGGDLDPSYGVYDTSSGAVGVTNQALSWLQTLTPLTPTDSYFAGAPGSLWAAIGETGAPGAGFNRTINSAAIDTAAGLQWNRTLSNCGRFSATWNVTDLANPTRPLIYIPFLFH
jgi:hypothetical protein